jgi:DNA invertase Pin-like site-specific DNA recombinase
MTSLQITPSHLARQAAIYIRQSTVEQVTRNLESQRRQYGLVDRAVTLGWPRPQVTVIDDDLGVSGSGVARVGFERLVAEVGLGHIGIVLALEVSRLARNNRDWYHLLDLCAMVDTLIADADGLYHPSVFNDRLLLGLKGTMSEVELHLIRSRLNGGLWEAARRGQLRTHLPIGYQHDRDGRIVKAADEAIRETIALVFTKFAELRSARQVTSYLAEEGVLLPHQRVQDDAVSWRRANFALVHRVLTNPSYAGVYAYGRSKIERRFDAAGHLHMHQVQLPLKDWAVYIPNHHAGYIGLEEFEANQQRLRAKLASTAGERWWSGARGTGTPARAASMWTLWTQNADHVHRCRRERFTLRVRPGAAIAGGRARMPGSWRPPSGRADCGRVPGGAGAGQRECDGSRPPGNGTRLAAGVPSARVAGGASSL